jgi:hypothetical protein
MKHPDRVLMALNHEEPDRCPMQTSSTSEFASMGPLMWDKFIYLVVMGMSMRSLMT